MTTTDAPTEQSTYDRLAEPFEETHRDRRGGVELEYITGEQCVSRLNQVLGPGGWTFQVKDHGMNAEADEFWVLGALEARIDGEAVRREQFGSNKIKRARQTGNPLDIGFDLKGAATDALKKTASLIGVGLYLSHKEGQAARQREATDSGSSDGAGDGLLCETCGQALAEIRFRDGTVWLPGQLAALGRRKHGRVLCMEHYREGNEARRRAEQAQDAPPFEQAPTPSGASSSRAPAAAVPPGPAEPPSRLAAADADLGGRRALAAAREVPGLKTNADPSAAPPGELPCVTAFYTRCANDLQRNRDQVRVLVNAGTLKEAIQQRGWLCRTTDQLAVSLEQLYDELAALVDGEAQQAPLAVEGIPV